MKAAVFYKRHDLRVEEMDMPVPGNGEVLIHVKACGICGTDVHIYEGAAGSAEAKPGTVPGHEFSGVVEKTGDGVKSVKPGDRVTVNPNIACGKCYFCKNGKEHFCENWQGHGVTINGGFAEYCVAGESVVYKVNDSMPFEKAAFAEPVACCINGLNLAEIKAGDTALIIGGGTIGMIMLQLARSSGAAKIILSEPVELKRRLGMELGVDMAVDPVNESLGNVLEGTNVDVTIECVGRSNTMLDAIRYTGRGGNVMLFGLTRPDCEIPLKPYELFQKELTIRGSFINPYTQQKAISLLESGRINVDRLISTKVDLDSINKVFEEKLHEKGKVIVCP